MKNTVQKASSFHRGWRKSGLPKHRARFCNIFGTPNWYEPGCAQCYLPRTLAYGIMYGGPSTSIADESALEIYVPNTPMKIFRLLGTDPSYSRARPEAQKSFLAELRARGVKSVSIDPRFYTGCGEGRCLAADSSGNRCGLDVNLDQLHHRAQAVRPRFRDALDQLALSGQYKDKKCSCVLMRSLKEEILRTTWFGILRPEARKSCRIHGTTTYPRP